MSLFRDDFYSTRVGRGSGRTAKRPAVGREVAVALVVISLLTGSVITLLLTRWLGGVQPQVLPVAAPGLTAQGAYDNRVVEAGEKVRPAVVSIITTEKDGDKIKGVGMGSGIIFRKEGGRALIVTNNHVVDSGNTVEVVLADSDRRKAEVIGKDVYSDLAVLSTDSDGIDKVAEFGDSDNLKPGEWAIAIGNPLGLNFSQTTTFGVISSPLRTIPVYLGKEGEVEWEMDVIQTDAAINQGNSGGALVNVDGKVIGINSMKISDMGVEGLGFAIPINNAKPILETLIKDKKIKRPKIGIFSEDLQSFSSGTEVLKLPESVKNGVIVTDVAEPAKSAGLKMRDVIVELDGREIGSTMELRKYLFNEKKIGDELTVTLYRAGKKTEVTVTLGELEDR